MGKSPRKINTHNLIEILKMSQEELKTYLYGELKRLGYVPVNADGFIFAQGDVPIMMVSHMDTFNNPPKYVKYSNGIMSAKNGLGADDRAGVYSILHLIRLGFKPTVLFTEDEEIGGIGATSFRETGIKPDDIRYIIELDRCGVNDAVFYECDNPDFTEYITSFGFVENWGSYSDICDITPELGIAGVNLSIGYHNEHSKKETLVISQMARTIRVVEKMLSNPPEEYFEYIEYSSVYQNAGNKTDKYMAQYGYYWSKSESRYVKKDDRYPIMMEGAWLVFNGGDLIDLDESSSVFYIDENGTIRDCEWREIDAYPVDYNFLPLDYEYFYEKENIPF